MDVVFRVERDVEVEYGRHVLDVEPARRHVGAYQQIDLALLEGVERFEAFVLALVTVQGGRIQALALQRARQTRTTELAVDEDESLFQGALAQHLVQGVAFVFVGHTVKVLLHRTGSGVRTRHFNRHRVLQVTVRQAPDFRRERGREQQGGALFG